LSEGLKQAGFEILAAIELDPIAVRTYESNHRGVPVIGADIRQINPSELRQLLSLEQGELDLLAGCPPCQGFSTLRTLNGAVRNRDGRNGLVREMLRFARAFLPKAVMMENVPGLLGKKPLRDLSAGLAELGYTVSCAIKDARSFGVPQRRRRLILLAGRGFTISFAAESTDELTVRDVLVGLREAGSSGDPLHDLAERRTEKVRRLISMIPRDGGSRLDLGEDEQLECHKKCNGFKDIYGRMSWDDVAPTITSGCFNPSKGRFLHPEKDRCITMREAAILQSFPRNYKFAATLGKQTIALMIGNALPPEFVRRHALKVKEAIASSAK
jgi:DNA (cytosine-5)-methyltransferase 1